MGNLSTIGILQVFSCVRKRRVAICTALQTETHMEYVITALKYLKFLMDARESIGKTTAQAWTEIL